MISVCDQSSRRSALLNFEEPLAKTLSLVQQFSTFCPMQFSFRIDDGQQPINILPKLQHDLICAAADKMNLQSLIREHAACLDEEHKIASIYDGMYVTSWVSSYLAHHHIRCHAV